MPSGPKKRKNAKKKKETALHVGAPTNIPEEVGGDEVKVVLEKSGGGVVLGRDDDENDADTSWNSKQTNPDSLNSTIEEDRRLRSHDSIGEAVEAVEVLKMDEKGEGAEEATVIAQGLEVEKDDAVEGVERVEDGKVSVELIEPPKVDDEKGGSSSSSSSRSSSSSSSEDGGSDSDRDKESEKQEVFSGASEESEKPEVLSGALEESEKSEVLSGAMNEPEMQEVLSGAINEPEMPEVLSGALDESEKPEVLSGALENSGSSEVLSGALEEPKKLEVLSSVPEVAEEACRIDKVEIPIESSGLESTIEVEKVTIVESVIVPDAAAGSIESEKEVTVKSVDNPGPENSIESAREEITETLGMSSSTEVHQEAEQQAVIVDATDKLIVDPFKDHEKSDKTEIERTLPPPIVQRTSWKGCCGLLDVFSSSNR